MTTEARKSEVTRYLCAKAQIDEKWCNSVLEDFLDNDFTAIAVSPGVHIPTVLRSCLHAKKRRETKNLTLAVLYFVSIIFLLTIFLAPLALIAFCTAWRILFSEKKKARHAIVAKYMKKGTFDPNFFNIRVDSVIEKKIEEIAKTQDANVLIYRGSSPFIGAGENIGVWSYSIDIGRGKEDLGICKEPSKFKVLELYDYIMESVSSLGFTNLVIEDYLCINGQELRGKEDFLPSPLRRPITKIDNIAMQYFAERTTKWARHYKCIRVSDWNGELILSVFVRFSIVQKNLFMEVNSFLLKPLGQDFHQIDQLRSKPSSKDCQKIAFETMLKSFSYGNDVIQSTVGKSAENRQKKRKRKEIEEEILYNNAFDYGAETSLRERVSQGNSYSQYFQVLDKTMYLSSIERRLINSIIRFLDEKNIDTSELNETKSTILNHGVIVSGGSFEANSLSVGEKSKAAVFSFNSAKNKIKPKTESVA